MAQVQTEIPNSNENLDLLLDEKIHIEQISLLYEHLPFALVGEAIVATFLCIALWGVLDHKLLISWLISVYLGCTLCRCITVYFFNVRKTALSYPGWLNIFTLGVFISGLTWGFAGGFLIPNEGMVYQTFVVFMLFGITAAANSIYSAKWGIYALFLITAISPFVIWLFLQGGVYILLGFSSFIYIGVMLSTSYYTNKLLYSSLALRFKNIDLDVMQKLLEKKITDRTYELKESLALTKSILESTVDGILVVNLDSKIQYYNQKFLTMWGFTEELIKSSDDSSLINFVKSQIVNYGEFVERIDYLYLHPEQSSFDEIQFKDGKVFERYSTGNKLDNTIIGRVWSFRDVTERKKMEQEIAFQANHDSLTGLPNRMLLNDRIYQAIAYAKRFQTSLTILFIDVDNFKYINDTKGHGAGDKLLKEIATRLKGCLRENDTIARFGGDEFVILVLTKIHDEIMKVIEKIYKCVSCPIKMGTMEVPVTISMGISIFPKDGVNPSQLLKNADLAMYKAKGLGRNSHQFYHKTLSVHSKKQMIMQSQLYNAVERNEFFLVYQPIVNLKTGEIISVEALIRWQNPKLGLINPNEFIPLAEKTGYIVELGEWVLRTACQQNKDWQNQGFLPIQIAVNVSGIQVTREHFIEMVDGILKETKLEPKFLEIELTESSIMGDTENIIPKLGQLKEMGVQISIDDFGTGYSSFSYLKDFPVNKLKIDKSFVQDCTRNVNDSSIIKAIITMGHQLNLVVLAEGVETEEQLLLLQQSTCDEIQGYLYSHPKDAAHIEKLLSAGS